jgi:hypothetical protein
MSDTYVNVGLLKKIQLDISKRDAMLMGQETICSNNPCLPLILNRTSRNPELVFNNHDPFKGYDPNLNSKWFPVKECFYANRHRYT